MPLHMTPQEHKACILGSMSEEERDSCNEVHRPRLYSPL